MCRFHDPVLEFVENQTTSTVREEVSRKIRPVRVITLVEKVI